MGSFTKLDESRVQAFIDWSQSAAGYYLHRADAASPSQVTINHWAWRLLKESVRGDEAHRYDQDYDAAAAEHYMYIRFLAGQSGDPACLAAPTLYAAKKILDQLLGRLQKGQVQGGHPVLPANPSIVAWGHRGVLDGLNDYKAVNKNASYKFGHAVESLAGLNLSPGVAQKLGNYAKGAGNLADLPYSKP